MRTGISTIMKKGAKVIVLLVVLCSILCSTRSLDISVDTRERFGRDEPACIEQGSERPCRTLQFVSSQLHKAGIDSNISVTVMSRLVHSITVFENISDLKLVGPGQRMKMLKRNRCSTPGAIVFANITTLYFSNFHVRLCGLTQVNHTVAMVIKNSTNVTIEDVYFQQCRETALLLANTCGTVIINRVVLHDNRLFSSNSQANSYSGGMEIIVSGSERGTPSRYLIEACNFTSNTAPSVFSSFNTVLDQDSEWRGNSVGGGLGVFFQGHSTENTLSIINCTFQRNFAKWGAGMHVLFQDEAIGNVVEVVDSAYIHNTANQAGGGVCIRYFVSNSNNNNVADRYNRIEFHNVQFTDNRAGFGAGMALFSVYSASLPTLRAIFDGCTWRGNIAEYASAVNIAPALFQRLENGHLPIPEFIDSTFVRNSLFTLEKFSTLALPRYYSQFAGIFVVTKYRVCFAGGSRFVDNTDSALYINSGRIVFQEGSEVTFSNNIASRGGAVAAFGYTSLVFNSNSLINFTQNYASELGAAIYYQSFDQHDFQTGRECFLKVSKEASNDQRNITILFNKNRAEIAGNAVYASTLYPCFFSNNHRLADMNYRLDDSIFDFIGDIQYYDNGSNALATNGRTFKTENLPALYRFIPGKLTSISVHPVDEFNQSSKYRLALLVMLKNGNIKADRKYTIKGRLRFFGRPGANDVLNFIQVAPRQVILSVNVTMLNCPPGFYFDSQDLACKCSAFTEDVHYYGIIKCDVEEFHSYLLRGFWIGYVPHTVQEPENLYTALCPLDFCKLNSLSNYTSKLPNTSSELSEHVCGANRKGTACGKCSEGYSPFFHSEGFKCGLNKLCSVGIIFYMLSELIPVVIIFTVVIIFDFSFTSGNISGFIFFCQTLELLSVNVKVYHDRYSYHLMIIARLFYDLFNLDYFSISELSFCLWKDATVIDLLAFKYVTVIFALGLVVSLILIMRHVKCTKMEKLLKIKERVSVIKGLSAFLIICYAQCAKTSFYILTPILLRTQGGKTGRAVTLFGGLPFLEGRHLFYAIMAILFILTLVTIPPLLLVFYPLSVQLLALCKLSEHWVVGKLLKVLQIYRLKPLIDSFQGCYKDRFRFFAGLYFIYRILILASYSITRSTSQFFIIAQFLLLAFMGLHSIFQPYRKQTHNTIDSLLFCNLVLINGCTIFLDVYNVESRENHFAGSGHATSLFVALQVFLLYVPMISFILWTAVRFMKFISPFCTLDCVQKEQIDLHSSNAIEEGIMHVVDYHEMQASTTRQSLISSIQEPPDIEQPKIKIRKVALQ